MADVDDISVLYTPIPVPPPLGGFNAQDQAKVTSLSGTSEDALGEEANLPTLPVGTGTAMYEGPMFEPASQHWDMQGDFEQSDISNVGGVTSRAPKKEFTTRIGGDRSKRREYMRKERMGKTGSGGKGRREIKKAKRKVKRRINRDNQVAASDPSNSAYYV